MAQGNWVAFCARVASDLQSRGKDRSMRLTLDQIFSRIAADVEPLAFRTRKFWANAQRGISHWSTLRDAGLVISFEPDATGTPVQSVTFRLEGQRYVGLSS